MGARSERGRIGRQRYRICILPLKRCLVGQRIGRQRRHREAPHLFVLAPEATAHHLHQWVEGLARILIEDHLFTELTGV